jgi:hypothetical protein
MPTKNREKLLFIIVVAFVGCYVLNLVVLTPLYNAWKGRQSKIEELKNQYNTGVKIQEAASSIEETWNTMASNTLSPDPSKAETQLFKSFQNWAAQSGVVLANQRPQPKPAEKEDDPYHSEEFHAEATGTLTQIFNFLSSVESSPMGFKEDSLELSARDERGYQLALSLTISGLILAPSTNNY